MSLSEWIDIFVLIALAFSFISFLRQYIRHKNLLAIYFALAALSIGISYVLGFFIAEYYGAIVFEWARFISITIIISALLVLIRKLKPVFARFPAYMTTLPFVSIAFFPLIADSLAIKELVNAIYQGGALMVSLLIFSINHFRGENRLFYRVGMLILFLGYTLYWFISESIAFDASIITEILFATGIILLTMGFTSESEDNNN